jgi:hypothetical protein
VTAAGPGANHTLYQVSTATARDTTQSPDSPR